MHIISGKFQRRSLKFPKNRAFRPTKSIVREAVFNIIGLTIEGASFLDACSGSGAVGIEAESRGAGHVVCVDKDTQYLNQNKAILNSDITVVRSDLIRYLKGSPDRFDFIYLDPIWSDHSTYEMGISLILSRQLLNPHGILLVEHDNSFNVSEYFSKLDFKRYQYGNSLISILKILD